MLTVLLHSGVGDICAVVTRYFGGTLLGTGGLVKAYSGGVQLALATLPTTERVPKAVVEVVIDYSAITLFKRLLAEFEVEVSVEDFAVDASFRLKLPGERLDAFLAAMTSLTSGQALIEVISRES